MRNSALGLLVVCWLSSARPAAAEPRDLRETQSERYYHVSGGLLLAGFGLSGLSYLLLKDAPAGPSWGSFRPDDAVERNFSAAAARLSDQLLLTSLATPTAFQLSHGFDVTAANAILIHGQTQALNSFLAMTAKLAARRPRPYTHSRDPRVQRFAREVGTDASMSFFSGHSSASFSSATAGSILYSARTELKWSRYTLWGLSHTVAGFTAQLRMCAGRHYRTDIWTGAVVGVGIGVLVPWLHGIDLSRVHDAEVGLAAGAGLLTLGLTEALGFCELMQRLGLRDLPAADVLGPVDLPGESEEGVKQPAPIPKPKPPEARWFILPAVLDQGIGVQLYGEL